MKSLTLSIIILAYNEETYLKSCLESIAAQTQAPNEVIVVDNNSTDGTVAIAQSYRFVTVIHEPVQGMIPARNAGFDAAKSDVLARIDADSKLAPDWVQRVHQDFADPDIMAVTGPAYTMTINPEIVPRSRLWSLVYFWATEAEFGIPILWGANMAIRHSAWEAIKSDVSLEDTKVHEDQDMSYLLAGKNLLVHRDNKLTISTDGQSHHDWEKFSEYTHRRFTTRRYHTHRATLRNTTVRLSLLKRLFRTLIILPPGILFVLTSIILVPLHLIKPKSHQR